VVAEIMLYFQCAMPATACPTGRPQAWHTVPVHFSTLPPAPVLQAFTIDKYNFPPPTLQQLRAQAFISVASGASGIFWYAYWDGYPYTGNETGRNQWVLSESPVLESLRTVHAELQEWIPIVCHGEPGPEIACDDDRIVVQSWLYEGKVHVLAVNAVAEPVEAALQGPAGQAVMDQAGTDRIRFAPLGVQSWIFPAHSTMHKKRL
jgi:hypothetical protein